MGKKIENQDAWFFFFVTKNLNEIFSLKSKIKLEALKGIHTLDGKIERRFLFK